MRDELLADDELARARRRKFEIKNMTGYRLCAFLDADEPLEIFRRLLIGSEGTLAFIAEAVFETRPGAGAHDARAGCYFADIDAAAAAVPELVAAGASATELMVAPTLIAAAWNMPGTPEAGGSCRSTSAALLVEFGGADSRRARRRRGAGARDPAGARPDRCRRASPASPTEIEIAWHVREGHAGLAGGDAAARRRR